MLAVMAIVMTPPVYEAFAFVPIRQDGANMCRFRPIFASTPAAAVSESATMRLFALPIAALPLRL